MAIATILLADDNKDFLDTKAEQLKRAGYSVVKASSDVEAINILQTRPIDVAVLDLRLRGRDEEDTSGLDIARKYAPGVPKIILTAYQDQDAMRKALRLSSEGLPHAVDYIDKGAGFEELLDAIKKALALASRFQRSIYGMSTQLERDYGEAHQQVRLNYWAALAVSIFGVVIVFVGAVLVFRGILETGIASAIAGIVTQAVAYLFFKRVDVANERMDRYHSEGLQMRSLEILLAACGDLPATQQQVCKSSIIQKAASLWFGPASLGEQLGAQSIDQGGQEQNK